MGLFKKRGKLLRRLARGVGRGANNLIRSRTGINLGIGGSPKKRVSSGGASQHQGEVQVSEAIQAQQTEAQIANAEAVFIAETNPFKKAMAWVQLQYLKAKYLVIGVAVGAFLLFAYGMGWLAPIFAMFGAKPKPKRRTTRRRRR